MKKLLSIIIAAMLILTMCSSFVAETQSEIMFSPVAGKPGETVNIIIKISEGTNLGNMHLNFTYDTSKLEYVGYKTIGVGENAMVVVAQNNETLAVGFIISTGITDGGEVLSMSFKIKSETAPDKIYVDMSVPEFIDIDTDFQIPKTVTSSFISVVNVMKGDISNDDDVTLLDAMLGFRWLAGKTELDETALYAADMDGNGKVGLVDIMKIFIMVAGK